ncbi:hypothetical protein FIBSPDRAFT_567880 [Athelia psychrophila]|uniref:Uncharacterized protein n=1 Tax=Athelia psychrophila TaxID=1759441 RepID=A0A166HUV4_9AGAM|nr:hypothetical protein FIBSPDRAFT_567880 [Fibularhizoctonia sp. CBS 109695]
MPSQGVVPPTPFSAWDGMQHPLFRDVPALSAQTARVNLSASMRRARWSLVAGVWQRPGINSQNGAKTNQPNPNTYIPQSAPASRFQIRPDPQQLPANCSTLV